MASPARPPFAFSPRTLKLNWRSATALSPSRVLSALSTNAASVAEYVTPSKLAFSAPLSCAVCSDAYSGVGGGVVCDGSEAAHALCAECLGGYVSAECAAGGAYDRPGKAPSAEGELPCPLFVMGACDCGALPIGPLLHGLSSPDAPSQGALGALLTAQTRVALRCADEERRAAELADKLARTTSAGALEALKASVVAELTRGQSVPCPGCGDPKLKNDACMHMTCTCGVSWCYCCGEDIESCPRGRGCDLASCFMEQNPGWESFARADRGESAAHGALVEFHIRRMAFFANNVKKTTAAPAWAALQAAEPQLLENVVEGRAIDWAELDGAGLPLFGQRAADAIALASLDPDQEIERLQGQVVAMRVALVRNGAGQIAEALAAPNAGRIVGTLRGKNRACLVCVEGVNQCPWANQGRPGHVQ